MSHFSVLVIGQDPDKQLAPYHEFECTGDNNEYVQDIDKTEELRELYNNETLQTETFAEYCESEGYDIAKSEKEIDIEGKHKYRYTLLDDKGEVLKVIERTNPNAQWDWYIIGGRWSEFFKLKEGRIGVNNKAVGFCRYRMIDSQGYADIANKGDIDFEGMMDAKGKKSSEFYDKVANIVGGELSWENWDSVRDNKGLSNDEAKKFYWSQPQVKKLQEAHIAGFGNDIDELLIGREAYIENSRNRAFVTYAVIKDGEWFARGKMGWWGASDDSMSQEEWNKKVADMVLDLPDDTLITIVDCHI